MRQEARRTAHVLGTTVVDAIYACFHPLVDDLIHLLQYRPSGLSASLWPYVDSTTPVRILLCQSSGEVRRSEGKGKGKGKGRAREGQGKGKGRGRAGGREGGGMVLSPRCETLCSHIAAERKSLGLMPVRALLFSSSCPTRTDLEAQLCKDTQQQRNQSDPSRALGVTNRTTHPQQLPPLGVAVEATLVQLHEHQSLLYSPRVEHSARCVLPLVSWLRCMLRTLHTYVHPVCVESWILCATSRSGSKLWLPFAEFRPPPGVFTIPSG
ncbi:hypothetical protein BJ875DRAFT_21141 [Amylocarpus encephaloides]|uniref:Uncharacterized protein n=1 Tax=Amylocarpus encephaloides TaxID=45428 RepID=A0A9P7YIL8_9HELO|nr:hypothetical protein BJ875DRAFT_21141 [Amylocarpus encephaloides]